MAELAAAAFRTGPFTITVDGSGYTFPSLTALRWLEILPDRRWALHLVQAMDSDSYERFLTGAEGGRIQPDGLVRIARAALAEAAGRPWWEAERLVMAALGNDRILGRVMMSGPDLERITLAVFCAVTWSVITHGAGPEDMLKLESQLTVPPPEALAEEIPQEQDLASLAQRLRQLPGVSVG